MTAMSSMRSTVESELTMRLHLSKTGPNYRRANSSKSRGYCFLREAWVHAVENPFVAIAARFAASTLLQAHFPEESGRNTESTKTNKAHKKSNRVDSFVIFLFLCSLCCSGFFSLQQRINLRRAVNAFS